MTAIIGRRNTRQSRHDASMHRFAIGQAVRLKGGFGRPALPSETYRITRMLPAQGNSPQYRIRNDDERHERMTTQDDLELVNIPQSSASLIERIFDHGQGTETKQPRD